MKKNLRLLLAMFSLVTTFIMAGKSLAQVADSGDPAMQKTEIDEFGFGNTSVVSPGYCKKCDELRKAAGLSLTDGSEIQPTDSKTDTRGKQPGSF